MFSAILLIAAIQPADAERFAKWEKEVAAVEKRLAALPQKSDILFYGSSSIRLWDLAKSFPEKHYLNAGFGGSEIRDCTHFIPRLVVPFKPTSIVFYAGDNDIADGRKPEQVRADFEVFCAAVQKELPKCRVLYLPVKPSLKRWAQFEAQRKANAQVKAFCDTDPRLAYIDTVPAMLGADGKPIPDLFVKDGLHLSAAGYAKWTPLVTVTLEKK
jgi:lysophospholipase L1-like esterase